MYFWESVDLRQEIITLVDFTPTNVIKKYIIIKPLSTFKSLSHFS